MLTSGVHVIGLDENGLGPILGPLVATAATLQLKDEYDADALRLIGEAQGIGDSKAVSAFGDMAHVEGVALAMFERVYGGVASGFDELLARAAFGGHALLSSLCPSSSRPQCWGEPVGLPAFGGDIAAGRRALGALEEAGARVRAIQTYVSCARRINDARADGIKLFDQDLHLFEQLTLYARAHVGVDAYFIAGMVGGIRDYPPRLRHLSRDGCREARAERGLRAYDIDGVGHLRFEVDADARHLPVALASMFGKYVRELSTKRLNDFYRAHDAELEPVSGYRDPRTKRFIAATEALRKRLEIADDCFTRRPAAGEAEAEGA